MSLRNDLKKSSLVRALLILDSGNRRKILFVSIIQMMVGLLDLVGILLVGFLASISLSSDGAQTSPAYVKWILIAFGLENVPKDRMITTVALVALVTLSGRTIFSLLVTKGVIQFLSLKGAEISANLIARMISQPLSFLKLNNSQNNLYSLTRGVEYITVYVLATSIVLASDVSILLILSFALLVIAPETMFIVMASFALILVILHKKIGKNATKLGTTAAQLNIDSNQKILEIFNTYREASVKNRRGYYAKSIRILRLDLARQMADLHFMPYASKYVVEGGVIVAALLVAGVQFVLSNGPDAISTLILFLAAGSRIGPAILRIQQGIIQINSGLGMSTKTLDLVDSLKELDWNTEVENDELPNFEYFDFEGSVSLSNINYKYPGNIEATLKEVNLEIKKGDIVAIVGRSGAGKSTLVDLILGIIQPDSGHVRISKVEPQDAIKRWSGAISYVPQEVSLIDGTVAENVALGYKLESINSKLIVNALEIAQLDSWVETLPFGISTLIGEDGNKISGGQRQRLGIARAVLTKPKLLVLDEATSALDSETELLFTNALDAIRGSTTVIVIAHRLSVARNADMVIYMSNGSVECSGTFDQVRVLSEDFDNQAKLMGL